MSPSVNGLLLQPGGTVSTTPNHPTDGCRFLLPLIGYCTPVQVLKRSENASSHSTRVCSLYIGEHQRYGLQLSQCLLWRGTDCGSTSRVPRRSPLSSRLAHVPGFPSHVSRYDGHAAQAPTKQSCHSIPPQACPRTASSDRDPIRALLLGSPNPWPGSCDSPAGASQPLVLVPFLRLQRLRVDPFFKSERPMPGYFWKLQREMSWANRRICNLALRNTTLIFFIFCTSRVCRRTQCFCPS
ncbi:uncharacterized protein BDZ99DRAFT_98985 [Mytilinidion resinicola]|uniref:Uncharacterized protein n=1 Tax=Mytilinidion resinicola TaxID=574789 RepID=A0A6A6YAG2_9PEZI|nr:uncharacterized protein BDZ99DRAFT_98985 [Mytilinidion resinicola]KAF2805811.1 hypothetical protein BDZ99DRAFT_98985 [Mytilinidion resinicola]